MMKTLCAIAVVVLSLTSVCQPAPLVCETLLKPVDKGPDLSGRWYLIALSTESCWTSTLLNAFFWPSIVVDVTAKDVANIYNADFKIKMYGFCCNESEAFFYENNKIFDVDSNNAPSGDSDVLLQSGCPDCIVAKGDDVVNTLMLFSRRKAVTAAELKEFETQTECLSWSKPQILNTDYEYENCKPFEDDVPVTDRMQLLSSMYERVTSMRQNIIKCIMEWFLSYIPAAYTQK